MSRGLPWLIAAQMIITLALLGFAAYIGDASTSQLIIGAVVGNWLSEGSRLGRQVSAARSETSAGDDPSTEDTGTTPKGA